MDPVTALAVSAALILANGLFVAAEYGLVSSRRSRIDSLAKRGSRNAKNLQKMLDELPLYVAGIQVAITMLGIGIGSFTEPFVSKELTKLLGESVPRAVGFVISLFLVTFVFVIVGELVPKYLTLNSPEKWALALGTPVRIFVKALSPLIWLVEKTGALILRLFGIDMSKTQGDAVTKEELALLLKSSSADLFEQEHAQVVSKALRLDRLDVNDIMIHRLDIRWIGVDTPREEIMDQLGRLSHSRIPVCRGDIDELQGIVYLQDVVRTWNDDDFSLAKILRPVEAVPENLTLSRAINRMREAQTQILIVMDEYGGTSGLITLEDIIEEVFGELEDQPESTRAPIERLGQNRVTARADVRYDELLNFLGMDTDEDTPTETLATIVINALGRIPKLGDVAETDVGKIRVENMARRRITRVWIQLSRGGSPADS